MTRRLQAVACVALFATLAITPAAAARQKNQNNNNSQAPIDQHAIGEPSYGPHHQARPYPWPTRIQRPAKAKAASVSAFTNRDCLDGATRALLNNLEARFGRVALVKVCVPGARMPSGHVSWHARHKAFDFKVPKGIDQRDVMVWLTRHSPGVTISYRGALAGIIHTDTGSFHKVIYAAADHEAGHRAVAIWQARAAVVASGPPLPKPRPDQPAPQPFVLASLGDDALREEPWPAKTPAPIEPGDRRDIFRRYIESQDVVVKPWVTTSCPGGKDLPNGLQALLTDAAQHFRCPVYINSAYRSPAYNRRVGGARSSEHMKCKAIDWRVACVGIGDLRRWVVTRLSLYGIGGLGTYGSHIHTDVRKATRLVTWGGAKKRLHRYAKHRKPGRYASAG